VYVFEPTSSWKAIAVTLRAGALGVLTAAALMSCAEPESRTPKEHVASVSAEPKSNQPPRVRLMTGAQYANTIEFFFGSDITLVSPFAPVPRTEGLLALGASKAGVTASQLQQFQRAASQIAAQVVSAEDLDLAVPGHRNVLVPCKPKSESAADDACAEKFLTATGRRLFRRPLEPERLELVVSEARTAATRLNSFYDGLAYALEGLLISPEMVFIADTLEPDPKRPGRQRLDAYALASRLSFFLWNAAPDDVLLDAAEKGELHTTKGFARAVDRMLASPRLQAGVRAFFDDMFRFDNFNNLSKDASVYPGVTAQTLEDARDQTLRTVVDHLVVRKKDYRDLFTTRSTFMSPSLAVIYKVPTVPGWQPYEFPANSPRVGLLTHVSFLTVHAHPGRSSPTRRGVAMREELLCQRVPLPPGNVDFSAVEDPSAQHRTARDRVGAHLTNPACAGCHRITDPVGLALENFDGAGQFRATDGGAEIDITGSLDGKNFQDIVELMQTLRNHPALPSCLVTRVYAYATGGPVDRFNRPAVAYFTEQFAANGYRLPDLLRAIALSAAFTEVEENSSGPAPHSAAAN
jgi:hypothetical protein